jgi:hypothetical protein
LNHYMECMVERNKEMSMSASVETLMKINSMLNELSAEELMMIAQSAQLRARNKSKSELKIGDKVTFDAKTRGIKTGILVKKNAKTFQVLVGSVNWKVTPTLLRKAA